MLFAADGFFLEPLFRSVRKPSTTESTAIQSVETDRGPPLVLSKHGQNARTRHYLYVDNIGTVSDQFSHVHPALDESKQDFEKDRLFLHEISVKSDSGWALGFELNVEHLRTLPAVERFGRIRKLLRCFLIRRRVAGWELEGLMGHVTFLGLSLFHCVYRFARKFCNRREPFWISARAELEAFVEVMILIESDRARL